jgi:hypothetical protein
LNSLDNSPSFPSTNPASTDTIFPFTYMSIQYFPNSQPLSPFPYPFCPPTTTDPLRQNLFHPHVLRSRQSEIFGCSDNYIGSFLVACPYLYVLQPDLVHLLYFSSFYFSPFLMVVSPGLKILYSFLHREINHIHLLNFFFCPPPLICELPNHDLFYIALLYFMSSM